MCRATFTTQARDSPQAGQAETAAEPEGVRAPQAERGRSGDHTARTTDPGYLGRELPAKQAPGVVDEGVVHATLLGDVRAGWIERARG